MGRGISPRGWLGVAIATAGTISIGASEIEGAEASGDTVHGFILAGLAVLLRSSKVVLQDLLMEPAAYAAAPRPRRAEPSLSPMHLWALQAPPCFLISLLYALCTEDVRKAWVQLTPGTCGMVAATCVSASVLNMLGMSTIKELGASSMQIIGKLNTIILVSFSVAFLGETLQPAVCFGAGLVLVGIAVFELDASSRELKSKIGPHVRAMEDSMVSTIGEPESEIKKLVQQATREVKNGPHRKLLPSSCPLSPSMVI